MKTRIALILWLFSGGVTVALFAQPFETKNSFNSSTPLRVLLHGSGSSVALRNMERAAVRLNGVLKTSKLSPGPVYFCVAPDDKLSMVRIPYQPLLAREIDLLWPVETIGFEMGGKSFRGRIRLVSRSGELWLINYLPLETYLAGAVGAEMNPSWPLEALKAQAVAARSYALYRAEHPRDPLYDIDSTTEDQVYLGKNGETVRTWNAVKATQSMVLMLGGEILKAHYHSRCGGITQNAGSVWKTRARAISAGIVCPFCRKFPFRWTASWSPSEFMKKLGLPSGETDSLRIESSHPSPSITVQTAGSRRTLTVENLRRALGYNILKSGHFELRAEPGSVQAQGYGSGHGVGMCQWGAKYLADNGHHFSEILAHYYPREKLRERQGNLEKTIDSPALTDVWSANDRSRRFRFSASRSAHSQISGLAQR